MPGLALGGCPITICIALLLCLYWMLLCKYPDAPVGILYQRMKIFLSWYNRQLRHLHIICLGHVSADGYVLLYTNARPHPASVGLWCMDTERIL